MGVAGQDTTWPILHTFFFSFRLYFFSLSLLHVSHSARASVLAGNLTEGHLRSLQRLTTSVTASRTNTLPFYSVVVRSGLGGVWMGEGERGPAICNDLSRSFSGFLFFFFFFFFFFLSYYLSIYLRVCQHLSLFPKLQPLSPLICAFFLPYSWVFVIIFSAVQMPGVRFFQVVWYILIFLFNCLLFQLFPLYRLFLL